MMHHRLLSVIGLMSIVLAIPAFAAEANTPVPAPDGCSGLARVEKPHGRLHPLRIRKAIEDGMSGFGVAVSSIGMKQPSCSISTPSEPSARISGAQPVNERVGNTHSGETTLAHQREIVELAARLNVR